MELKPGYKLTEVGVIPEDWAVDLIKNVAIVTTGSKNTQDRVDDGNYPFFVRSQIVERINSYSFDGEAVLTAGDGVGTGKVFHHINGKFDVHQRVYRISNFAEDLNGYFFYLYFSNHFYNRIMQMTAKSSVDSVRMDMIANMSVPLPPLTEQRAIAEALSDVDALLDGLDRLIAKQRDLKQATMQQLLTGQTRLPGFTGEAIKQSEIGTIPNDWEIVALGDHADITKLAGFEYTNYFNSYRDEGEVIVVRGTNITNNILDLSDIKTIPTSTSRKLPRSKLNKGDLVFAYVGTIGPVYLIEENDKYHLGPNTAKITCKAGLSNTFLFTYFTSELIKGEITEKISIGAQPSLSMAKIRKIRLIYPPLPEQTAIAAVLTDMDAELVALEARRAKTRLLKQAMMQELLTGKTRLT